MKNFRAFVFATLVAASVASLPLFGQLGAPNASGVSIGHVHLMVRDPDLHRKLWAILGGQTTMSGTTEMIRFPGIYVILSRGASPEGTEGSAVNHIGFSVKNVDEIKAKLVGQGLVTVRELTNPKRWVTVFPDKVMVEFTEDPNQKVPVAGHHLHLSTNSVEPLRDWYVKTFGGTAEIRRGFPAVVFDGGEINILTATAAQAPTNGRSLDHIGFEVRGLEAFCKKLEAQGVKFESSYHDFPAMGVKSAMIVDPVGTRIELTEGLRGR